MNENKNPPAIYFYHTVFLDLVSTVFTWSLQNKTDFTKVVTHKLLSKAPEVGGLRFREPTMSIYYWSADVLIFNSLKNVIDYY